MKLISFDIGIKNMAYCILSISQNKELIIEDWNILNLKDSVETTDTQTHICSCINKPKNKKDVPKKCGNKAKYKKNNIYYCEKHSKQNTEFIIPSKQHAITYLRKQKIDELINIIITNKIIDDVESLRKIKKPEIITKINDYFQQKSYELISVSQPLSSNDIDLIQIGRNMNCLLDKVERIENITHVIIENQISTIASRMKTIQGMLAQYFIMKHNTANITFVSSINKLKQFNHLNLVNETNKQTMTKNTTNKYKEHKLDGIYYCNKILSNNESISTWAHALNTKKKDDYADSFLQGIWFLNHNNILLYAEDLNIKIV